MKILTILLICVTPVLADDFKTIDGKEYKDATVTRVEADGIVVKSRSGISKLYFGELPKEVQQRFHYDSQTATAYAAEQAAAIQRTNQEIQESNKRAEVEKRQALDVSRPAQSAAGVSRQDTANGPHIIGVGGVDGLTVEMSDKHLQLQAAAREEAQTPEEKAARYAANMRKYEGAKQTAARRGLNSNNIVPPRYGQLYYDPFANFK
jgi:hypothetical protein